MYRYDPSILLCLRVFRLFTDCGLVKILVDEFHGRREGFSATLKALFFFVWDLLEVVLAVEQAHLVLILGRVKCTSICSQVVLNYCVCCSILVSVS